VPPRALVRTEGVVRNRRRVPNVSNVHDLMCPGCGHEIEPRVLSEREAAEIRAARARVAEERNRRSLSQAIHALTASLDSLESSLRKGR